MKECILAQMEMMLLPINQAPIFQPTYSRFDQIESRPCETSCGNRCRFLALAHVLAGEPVPSPDQGQAFG